MNIKILVPTILTALLCACANPFVQYYHPNNFYDPSRRVGPPSASPQIYAGSDFKQDTKYYLEEGYAVIGTSSFNGPSGQYSKAVDEGEKVGADIVILYSRYTNTVSGVMPLTTPHTETSTTNMNGSVYGTGGMVTINGTATTDTYGSQTTYIPYSVNRSDYMAVYLAKSKPRFGAYYINLSDNERQTIGSNSGVKITLIVNESPAFYADILPGDIILKINGLAASDVQTFISESQQFGGQQVKLTILRNGKTIQKSVKLNE
ncbi:MAG: PDZ domain-containing protein [Gammaproteobacteria bacterium]